MAQGTQSESSRIAIPRFLRRPIKVRITDSDSGQLREYSVRTPLRVGHGENCDVRLDGDTGPDTLLEFLPVDGPTKLSMPARFHDNHDQFEVTIDDEPFVGNIRELQPGTKVQVRNRKSNRHVDLIVDEPSLWTKTPRWLIACLMLIFISMLGYGALFIRSIDDAKERISQTELRLNEAETRNQKIDAKLADIIARVDSSQVATDAALDEIRSVQRRAHNELTSEFNLRMRGITEESQHAMLKLAREDTKGREVLAQSTSERVEALRQEISAKLISGIERFKVLEEQVYRRHAEQLETLSVQGSRFKRVLPIASQAVLYVQSEFSAVFTMTGETKRFESSGTGFLVSASGVAVAPLHVLEPWRFDEDFLALESLGAIELEPGSLKRYFWLAGQQVINPQRPEQPLTDEAFADNESQRSMIELHKPDLETVTKLILTPLGVAEIARPMPGPTDLAVFQLIDFSRQFAHLSLADASDSLQALDEVLVVGFPLGRLDTGRAVAQGVMGSVRRVGANLLELDTQLHPGISGAPVLNDKARVVGMAIAVFGTVSYGVSVPANRIEQAIELGRNWVRSNEQRLAQAGCMPGLVDGELDEQTWKASKSPGCALK